MSDARSDHDGLSADLAHLRNALRAVDAPPLDEAALRAAFREARRRASAPPRAAPAPRKRWAVAAAVLVTVTGALAVVLLGRAPGGDGTQAAAAAAPPVYVAAFQPLASSPRLLPAASYSVVRVRIPLSSLALVPGSEQGGTVEAELLVGEDGLARGIRFLQTDTMLVSAQP
jgi:hypothetical protein